MEKINNILTNIRLYSSILLVILLFPIAIMTLVALQGAVPVTTLVRDTVDLAGMPVYAGIISDLGIYFWLASTTVCFFTALILLNVDDKMTEVRYIAILGVFILFLAIDDRILLHDRLIDGGEVIYLPYALFTVAFLFYFRRVVFAGPYVILFLAYGFLAVSIGVDSVKDLVRFFGVSDFYSAIASQLNVAESSVYEGFFVLEDGAKLIGIVALFGYCLQFGLDEVVSSLKKLNGKHKAL